MEWFKCFQKLVFQKISGKILGKFLEVCYFLVILVASKIAKQHKLNYTVRYNGIIHTDSSEAECYNSAMDMAQRKDNKFKEQIKIIKDNIECMLCVVSGFNDERSHGYQDCGMKVMEMIDKVFEL